MVCPAFAPPWNLTIISAFSASMSVIFPLPSSPQFAPTTALIITQIPPVSDLNFIKKEINNLLSYINLSCHSKHFLVGIQNRIYNFCNKAFGLLFGTSHIFLRIHGFLKLFQSQVKCRIGCDQLKKVVVLTFYLNIPASMESSRMRS